MFDEKRNGLVFLVGKDLRNGMKKGAGGRYIG